MGHALALLLARERLRVGLVVAPAPAAPADVRAYALNQRARALLQDLRCWPEAPEVTPVAAMHVKETGGGSVHFDAGLLAVPALAWIVDVPALEARLAQAVRFQPQISLLEAAADATLTVVCEGRASVSRAQFGVEQDVIPYEQWAIATRLQGELPHQQVACQWFTPHDILGLLPMGGEGGNLLAAVWSIPVDQKDAMLELATDMFEDRLFSASEGRFGRLRLASARLAWPLQRATALHWSGVREAQHELPDRVGPARADERRGGARAPHAARYSFPARTPARRRAVVGSGVHRTWLPARVLLEIPRIHPLLPALDAGPFPRPRRVGLRPPAVRQWLGSRALRGSA